MIRRARWLLGVAALALAGCDSLGSDPAFSSSTTEATVVGKVTVQGKPLTKGTITFNPANTRRKFAPIRQAPIGDDGRYSITTLVGNNSVTVEAPLPKKLSEVTTQVYAFEVKPGQNTYDLDLVPPPAP